MQFLGNFQIGNYVTIHTNIWDECCIQVYGGAIKLFEIIKTEGQSSIVFFLDRHTFGHHEKIRILILPENVYRNTIIYNFNIPENGGEHFADDHGFLSEQNRSYDWQKGF